MKRIVLIDDHHLVRAGLKALIECLPDYEVVAEGSDGSEGLSLVEEYRPDILITDIAMGRVSGLEMLPEVKSRFPELAVIVLSMHASRDFVLRALRAGASAYLLKDAAEVELELALQSVSAGHRYMSPKVSKDVLDTVLDPNQEFDQSGEKRAPLTQRQREILRLIALGKGTKEVAYELGLSSKTIDAHRAQIMDRLGIRDIASLVRYAIRNGIVGLEED